MENSNGLIIERAIKKATEIHLGLCAAMADLEATGPLTKDNEAGRCIQEARAGLDILLRILRGDINVNAPYGMQRPQS
jgi:hypothetical protein